MLLRREISPKLEDKKDYLKVCGGHQLDSVRDRARARSHRNWDGSNQDELREKRLQIDRKPIATSRHTLEVLRVSRSSRTFISGSAI